MSKKSKSVKVIYICTTENDMFYWVLINSSQDIEDLIIEKLLTQQKFNKNLQL